MMGFEERRAGLEQYQWKLLPNMVYKVRKLNSLLSNQQVEPNIMIKGCVADIYGLNSSEYPKNIDEMICPECNKGVTGFAAFGILPCYICCHVEGEYDENEVSIIISGIEVLQEIEFESSSN